MSDKDMGRQQFLISMYDQTWNNINRHINVIWQPIGILIASLGLLSLGEKNIINFDLAISLIILLSGWFIAHVYDSSHWYNRNLVILSNIEKQFLTLEDKREVQYFFARPFYKKEPMITHFKLQKFLGYGIVFLVLFYHLLNRINFVALNGEINILTTLLYWLPYITLICVSIYLYSFIQKSDEKYKKLIKESPGKKFNESEQ